MKKLFFLLSTLALILALIPAGMTQAKKPAPKLVCTIEYWWMPGWAGTISGDINGVIVWLPVADPPPPKFVGQTNHYEGRFEIYDSVTGAFIMAGEGAGSTTVRHQKNSVWRSNGKVTDAGEGFEDWIGRKVHQDGHFTWTESGAPEHGIGTLQVN